MFRPRVIPVLLLKSESLVKTVAFKNERYIGDPINAVRIYNDLNADELIFLDILASKENRTISKKFVEDVGFEANMPFAVGGGIRTLNDIGCLISSGAEKVVINSYASENPDFIRQASSDYGSSTISVCMDVKASLFKGERVWALGGKKVTKYAPEDFAKLMEENGAGELIIQSISRDGMMSGYDIPLIRKISEVVSIPVIALGGAASLGDFRLAYTDGFASGVAAGSVFVYHGAKRGVLLNYPHYDEISTIF
jgi:cyclase